MWAVDNGNIERHFFGGGTAPIAVCDYNPNGEGKNPRLDYTKIDVPKCKKCMEVVKKWRKPK